MGETECMPVPRLSLVMDFEQQAWQDLMHRKVHSEFEGASACHRAVLRNLAMQKNGAGRHRFAVSKAPWSCQTCALELSGHIGHHYRRTRQTEVEDGSDGSDLTRLDYVRRDRARPQPLGEQQHLLESHKSFIPGTRMFLPTDRNACYGTRA